LKENKSLSRSFQNIAKYTIEKEKMTTPSSSSSSFQDHYFSLGISVEQDPSEVSLKDINDAYKRIARKYHPDKLKKKHHGVEDQGAARKFLAASQAVETLRDSQKRHKFDEEYRLRKREERRRQQEDERTKRMRIDLEKRERDNREQNKQTSNLEKLKRENAEFMQSTSVGWKKSEVKTATLEEHLTFERDVLARAMRYAA
jgi:curved DNA-binding protein CbpA